ncbi:oligosaccharide flippase family protein [Exiguobacterium sp. 22311]|uniref:oligosaccharide flippase family protein n=1 Tax=Exiguobacterium sp. 22311 TaxID=3453907 RepID=UPI003F84B5BD
MEIFYLIFSQLIGVCLGILKSIVLPAILTVKDFGYWQIYLLYVGYLGVLSVGFNDGILIKYGKNNYTDLLKKNIGSTILLFLIFQILISIFFLIGAIFFSDGLKRDIFFMIAFNIPLVGLNGVFLSLFQSTNQIKKYSYFTIIDKVLMIVTIISIFFLNDIQVLTIIIADTVTRLIAIILMAINFKALFKTSVKVFSKVSFIEIIDNIKIGFYILISNLIAMLLIGYSLFLIERFMPLINYSIYALGISTTNILLLFISAVSVFIFPNISRIPEKKLNFKMKNMKELNIYISLSVIPLYFVIHQIIQMFLKDYILVLDFLPFIFLAIVVQIEYNMILVPYSKVIRKEKKIFLVNLITLSINIIFTTCSVIILDSLLLTSIIIYLSFIMRNYLLEYWLFGSTKIKSKVNLLYIFSQFLFLFNIYVWDHLSYSIFIYFVFMFFVLLRKRKLIYLNLKGDLNG